jgi:hypothetical protein
MEKRKTIQINPDFFKLGKKTKSNREKRKRLDLRQSIKPNNLKKQLLARIKNHQQEQSEKDKQDSEEKLEEFQNDFNSSLNYLQTMIKQKKEKKKKRTRKKQEKVPSSIPIPTSTPTPTVNTQPFSNENVIAPQLVNAPSQNSYTPAQAPPYGCLKNGSKPTYSQYMKTMKKTKKATKPTLILPPKPPPTPSVLERKEKLNKLKETMALPKKEKILKTISKKRTIKIFKLGKKDGKVGVLVKSGKTKRYLRKHNLIKAGTTAPENVLRKLYEDSFLAGDIYNRNADILLHNFMQEQQ